MREEIISALSPNNFANFERLKTKDFNMFTENAFRNMFTEKAFRNMFTGKAFRNIFTEKAFRKDSDIDVLI